MWKRARKMALSDFERYLRNQGIDGSQLKESTKHFEEELRFWLGENRHDPGEGVAKEIVANVCKRVGAWAAKRGGQDEDRLLLTAATLASRLTAAVEASGSTTISRTQLARIIDSVVAEGAENPDDYPEAAPWNQVRYPGQMWGSVGTVIWWNCVSAEVRATRLRWTKGEIDFLERNGVKLEDSASARIREALSWHRPALMAQKRLMLIAPRSINGEVVSPHPVWDEIRHLLQLDNSEGSAEKITFTASKLTEGEKVKLNGRLLKRNKVAIAPLPAPQGKWHINKSGGWRREKESFTSMTKLIECPLAWFFAYVLKLYPGTLMSLPEGSQMLGTLSHALVQRLFSEWAAMSPAEAKARAEELYDLMVPEMAAPLLQPGLELERERYREAISRAIEKLVSLLQSARLKVSGSEETFEKEFLLPGKTFEGRIDLLLETPGGEKVIWDLKWSTRAKYKREELEGGKALQLAAYAWLLAEADGSFPPAGYFMLSQGELLSVSCKGIPDHCQFQEVDLKNVWESGVAAYRRRNKQLEQGVVVAAAVLPEEEEDQDEAGSDTVLELEPNCRWCDYVNLCGAERQPNGK
jgi:RecB family exonuclease